MTALWCVSSAYSWSSMPKSIKTTSSTHNTATQPPLKNTIHKKGNRVKLFVSLELPAKIKKEIEHLQTEVKKLNSFDGSYVAAAHLHCTLFFIGNVDDTLLPDIKNRLASISLPAFTVTIDSLSFNASHNPHVLWLSLDSPCLTELAQKIKKKLPEWGDERGFKGHITIARVKKVSDKQAISSITVKPLTWRATEFHLKQSTKLEGKPLYTTASILPLV